MSGWPGWLAWLEGPLAALTFFAVMGLMSWAGVWIAGRIIPPRPRATVRSTGLHVTFGCITVAVALVFLAYGFLAQAHVRPGQFWWWVVLVGFFAGSGLLLCLAGFRQTVRWDRKGLTQTGLLYGSRSFAWSEITAFEPRGTRLALRRGERRTDLCALGAEGIEGLLKAAHREGVANIDEVRRHLPIDRGNRPLP